MSTPAALTPPMPFVPQVAWPRPSRTTATCAEPPTDLKTTPESVASWFESRASAGTTLKTLFIDGRPSKVTVSAATQEFTTCSVITSESRNLDWETCLQKAVWIRADFMTSLHANSNSRVDSPSRAVPEQDCSNLCSDFDSLLWGIHPSFPGITPTAPTPTGGYARPLPASRGFPGNFFRPITESTILTSPDCWFFPLE